MRLLLVMAAILQAGICRSEIIPADRTNNWSIGYAIGPQVTPTLGANASNVVVHGADNTGATDARAAIQAVIDNCATAGNSYVYLPNGVYRLNSALTLNYHNAGIWGQSTNAILWQMGSVALTVGHGLISPPQSGEFDVDPDSATKGSTNLHFMWATNQFGDVITAGESFHFAGPPVSTNTFRLISTFGYNPELLFRETVVIHTISGTNATITAPLRFHHTNSPRAISSSYIQIPSSAQMKTNVVVGNFTVTTTNFGTGSATTTGNLTEFSMLRNFLVTNLHLVWAGNRHMKMDDCVNGEIADCSFRWAYEIAPNHAGLLVADCSGLLIRNSIFADRLFPAIEYNEGFVGNAIFGNFFTNCGSGFAIDCHNSHPHDNLWEANILDGDYYKSDGYFGSVSDQTLFRNSFLLMDNKRFTTRMNVIGCVVGDPSITTYTYDDLMKTNGLPNLGNNGSFGSSPPDAWNYPGPTFQGPDTIRTNGQTTIGSTATSDTFSGDFSYLVASNDFPSDFISHPIVFQHQSDTNILVWPGTIPILVLEADGTHVKFNQAMTLTAGMRVFAGGSPAWQQRQIDQVETFIVHGCLVYTNAGGTVVWDADIADHDVPESILHPSGAPAWWGTNRWPAVDPEGSPTVAANPAKDRYYGIASSGGPAGSGPTGTRLSPLAIPFR